jgi:transcriptional regulator with XRE-family HTH domain
MVLPLRAWRENLGLSTNDVAALTGLSNASISLIERGIHRPRLQTRIALARGLDMSIVELDALLKADDPVVSA